MTGFGAGKALVEGEELVVELKSLNHKFAEIKLRLPRELANLELSLTRTIKERVTRGVVEATVRRSGGPEVDRAPQVDVALARAYLAAYGRLASELNMGRDVSLSQIAAQPGVIRLEDRGLDLEKAQRALTAALEEALTRLIQMREQEGTALAADLAARLTTIERLTDELEPLAPRSVEEHRARLSTRVRELSGGVAVDPQRLAQEVAFLAERSDINEELTRLRAHLAQFRALLASGEPAGRKMDFLVQEMHREVNTSGSKSQSGDISQRVVALKAELERVREQVQNVE